MVLHSELTVIERWRHSFDVFPDVNRTIPFACGATLSYNYVDLQLLTKPIQHTALIFGLMINIYMGNYLLILRYVINMKFSKRSIALSNNGGEVTQGTIKYGNKKPI